MPKSTLNFFLLKKFGIKLSQTLLTFKYISMISTSKCQNELNTTKSKRYQYAEVELLRDFLYVLAEIEVSRLGEAWFKKENNNNK